MDFVCEEVNESTQPVADSQLENSVEDDQTMFVGDPWGRLAPSSAAQTFGFRSHELKCCSSLNFDNSLGKALELDIYTVGRNPKCDVVIDDSRVSGCHCRIYRTWEIRPGLSSRLLPYVEDTSSNGTFVNKNKLKRRERRLLSSGDELTFLSPKIFEARFTAHVFIYLSPESAAIMSEQGMRTYRSLTLAATASDRNLEKDFQLCEEIGSGTIGKVYRAISRASGQFFAAKIIPTRRFAFQRTFSAADLLEEARMLRNLCHPAIVSVHDAYNEADSFAIVMQLVEGGDLFDRIVKRGRYPESDARDTMRNLLSALAYLHARGIAHRDVKPENILLRTRYSDVDVLLTDFGLAKGAAVGSHGCRTFCGTPQYLAPEVMEHQIGIDSMPSGGYDGAAADMWSSGIVLFVLLSGTQPTNSIMEHKRSACSFDDEEPWRSVSAEAKDTILKLTSVEATQRPSAASCLSDSWLFLGCIDSPSPQSKRAKHVE
mmetsp:Transcript_15054/g.46759  ORF Transcript_15054/g.46759 Transcript_15054/m.46759 type:complete len:487 (+) Transcript_15054:58-1518(+)